MSDKPRRIWLRIFGILIGLILGWLAAGYLMK
jgi:LPS O-antigen subunit length determinant protein (WzzB/FepE family)